MNKDINKSKELEVSLQLVNNKLHFMAYTDFDKPVSIDYVPPFGDNLGYTSLELLLMSLASCYGSTLQLLFKKMNKTITSMDIKTNGQRKETHPTCFSLITIDFTLESTDLESADVEKAIKIAEESLCPVYAMVKGNVEVKTTYTII